MEDSVLEMRFEEPQREVTFREKVWAGSLHSNTHTSGGWKQQQSVAIWGKCLTGEGKEQMEGAPSKFGADRGGLAMKKTEEK